MRILDLASLPAALRPQLAAFGPSDGDPPQDLRLIGQLRRWGFPATDYWGVYAVEDGALLSRVEVLDLPFSGLRGAQRVAGISDVLTRPEGVGRGYARALLQEVHRREAARGRRWSFLWTHRTWGAHRLYESLGYRDVYSPPLALRAVPRSPRSRTAAGERWRPGRPGDTRTLNALLAAATRGRAGFVPRPPGFGRARLGLGWRRLENFRILWRGNTAVGYAYLSEGPGGSVTVNEVAARSPGDAATLVGAIEDLAKGRWLVLQTTSFVRDAEGILRERGFSVHPATHSVLMARPLVARAELGEDLGAVGRDPSFSNHRGDMF